MYSLCYTLYPVTYLFYNMYLFPFIIDLHFSHWMIRMQNTHNDTKKRYICTYICVGVWNSNKFQLLTLLLAVSCSGELARVRPPQPRVEWASIINLQKQKMPQSCSCTQREEQFQPLMSSWLELRWLPCGPEQITLLLLLS